MNLKNEIARESIASFLETNKKIFFMRVCGTGMGACAVLLKEAGFEVDGADVSFAPPMSDFLNDMEIPCHDISIVDSEFLSKYDLIVVGNAVGRKSDTARMIEECGIPFTSFPAILGESILKERDVIAIIGTHGKTTTSYFLVQMLESMGIKPGCFIGGVIDDRCSSVLGEDKLFIIEGDEYDSAYFQKYSKFHQYFINDLVCTSVEFDHADIFEDLEAVKLEFKELFEKMKGHISYDPSYLATSEILEDIGYTQATSYAPKMISESSTGTVFELDGDRFETNVIGHHNILNISGCIQILLRKDFSVDQLNTSIKKLGMVKRRQESRGHYKDALFIDDFAHHPKAIYETTKAIKLKYPDKKIHIVFEPVSATARSNVFQEDFANSFRDADEVVIADTGIQTTAKSYDQLDTSKLVEDIKKLGINSRKVTNLDELIGMFDVSASSEALFLILSNRTCLGLWSSDFVKKLK